MIIHLSAMAANLKDDITYVRAIQDAITAKHSLALDWIEATYQRILSDKVKNEDMDWTKIAKNHMDAIARADLIIMEATRYSFHHGFQSAYALMKQKPVLFLYREDIGRPLDGLFASGITNELFRARSYKTQQDLEPIVSAFLDEYANLKETLSLELDHRLVDYLEALALKANVQKSEIVRNLLLKNVEKDSSEIL